MQIFLIVLGCITAIIVLFIFTDIKVYAEFDNVLSSNRLKVKLYIFSILPVFIMKKEIKSDGKKKTGLKEKIDMGIEYFIKSKADPVDYAKKEVKESDKLPNIVKMLDFKEIYLEKANLNLCLDFNNAAISAIGTGAINAIISMMRAKYANNIVGPVVYKIFPGYTGNGVKVEVFAKIKVKTRYILKLAINYLVQCINNKRRKKK